MTATARDSLGRPNRTDYALLLLLGALWGGSFMLIKLAVATVPPLTLAAGRIAIGAAVLVAVVRWRGIPFPTAPRDWAFLFAMGSAGTLLPFALINWGETHIDSSMAAILISAVPISTIILAHLFQRDEPLTIGNIAGVLLGCAGIIILIGPGALGGLGVQVLGQLAIVGATLCYAGTSILARRLSHLPSELVAAGMLMTATLVAVPASIAVERPWQLEPSAGAMAAVLGLGLGATACGYLLLFRIIARAGAGFSSFNNFLAPLCGVMWGALLLGESIEPRALAALAIVLAGLAALRLWPRPVFAAGQADKPRTSAME